MIALRNLWNSFVLVAAVFNIIFFIVSPSFYGFVFAALGVYVLYDKLSVNHE